MSGLVLGANANSLCGNGIKDLNEGCDYTDESHDSWGNKGCGITCKPIKGKKYDKILKRTLRKGKKYSFDNTYSNKKNNPIKIKKFNYKVLEEYDLNGDKILPKFIWTPALRSRNYIINSKESMKILISKDNSQYAIVYNPPIRSYDNFIIEYTISHTNIINGKEVGYYTHVDYVKYEVSWCGDGIKDFKYNESCDDGNRKSGDGCSSTCQLEN